MNKQPNRLFPGYNCDGNELSFPISSLAGLTTAEAHPTLGDWRAFFFSLCSTMRTKYMRTAVADRDESFKARTPTQRDSGIVDGAVERDYAFTFLTVTELTGPDVVDEP